jgi:hypothetical protein
MPVMVAMVIGVPIMPPVIVVIVGMPIMIPMPIMATVPIMPPIIVISLFDGGFGGGCCQCQHGSCRTK